MKKKKKDRETPLSKELLGLILFIGLIAGLGTVQSCIETGQRLWSKLNPSKEKEAVGSSASIPGSPPASSPITLQQFYAAYYDKSLTELQQKDFLSRTVNKKVTWQGIVTSVDSGRDFISVGIRDPESVSPRPFRFAMLFFGLDHHDEFLKVNIGDEITVAGVLEEEIRLAPSLKDCELLDVRESRMTTMMDERNIRRRRK